MAGGKDKAMDEPGSKRKPRGPQLNLVEEESATSAPADSAPDGLADDEAEAAAPAGRGSYVIAAVDAIERRVGKAAAGGAGHQLEEEAEEPAWVRKLPKERQEFYLPLSKFVHFSPAELEVINHPAFQRLGKINQLGFSYLVFRGATHKRFEHVLGAVGVAERVICAIDQNAEAPHRKLEKAEKIFIRLGALLHDIGHVAYGHTLEDELGLIGKHDEDERLYTVFNKTDWADSGLSESLSRSVVSELREITDANTQPLAEVIDAWFDGEIPEALRGKIKASEIVWLLIRKPPQARTNKGLEAELRDEIAQLEGKLEAAKTDVDKAVKTRQIEVKKLQVELIGKQQMLDESDALRFTVCSRIIGNTICADLLDYISRDWFHVGKLLSDEDRIFHYMEIREDASAAAAPRHKDQFVVSLGRDTDIRDDGVSAILGLLERRHELAEMVLYHKTKLAAGAVLDRALFEITDGGTPIDLVEDVLCLSDDQLLDYAVFQTRRFDRGDLRRTAALRLIGNLRLRILPKVLLRFDGSNKSDDDRVYLGNLYAPGAKDPHANARHRADTARALERDFDLEPGTIVMSCSIVKPKIAKVAVRVNDDIAEFQTYEETHKNKLSGGHLTAQIKRFDRMWRLDFFMNEREMERQARRKQAGRSRASVLTLIQDTIRYVIASTAPDDQRFDQAQRIAREYAELSNTGQFYREGLPAAAKSSEHSALAYPNGATSISYFIDKGGKYR